MEKIEPSFGDNVRIRSTPETVSLGFAGLTGSVLGFTTPSVSQVEVVGLQREDYALCVMFEDTAVPDTWFARDLVEFLDHAPGTEARIGNLRAVRNADGTWTETFINGTSPAEAPVAARPWWKFWGRD